MSMHGGGFISVLFQVLEHRTLSSKGGEDCPWKSLNNIAVNGNIGWQVLNYWVLIE